MTDRVKDLINRTYDDEDLDAAIELAELAIYGHLDDRARAKFEDDLVARLMIKER